MEWPALHLPEIQKAIATTLPQSAPGTDRINGIIIRHTIQAMPDVFELVYSTLFTIGHHPTCWKSGIGIILPKPQKPDYTIPKAYRVITLLNCLGKVLEKLYAKRLGHLANTTSRLLHNSQLGGRLQRSAVDTTLRLLHHLQQNRQKHGPNTVSSTAFLDVKGAFDHVKKPVLL